MPLIPRTRRQFLYRAALVGAVAIAGDSLLLEPSRPRIVRRDFVLPRWPEQMNGFTIALLSDFHYDPYFSVHPLRRAIPLVNGLRPDLIVLTGDFVSVPAFGDESKAAIDAEPCARLLCRMTAPWVVGCPRESRCRYRSRPGDAGSSRRGDPGSGESVRRD